LTRNFFKRACAYIFDILILSVLVSLLSYLPILNPNREQYSEKYNELIMVREQLDKNEISLDEFEQAYKPIAYELYRLNTNYVVIDLVCVLLYFVVFQYFFDGQTLGKRLFQIKIVSNNDEPLTILNYFLRAIVLSNVLISIALQCIVHFMSVDSYYEVYQNVNLVGSLILYIIVAMVLVRYDGRGLHDFVGNTKVIVIEKEMEEKKERKKEEQKVLESEYEIKEKKVTKKKSKRKENTK